MRPAESEGVGRLTNKADEVSCFSGPLMAAFSVYCIVLGVAF